MYLRPGRTYLYTGFHGTNMSKIKFGLTKSPSPHKSLYFPSNRAILSCDFSTFCRKYKKIPQKQTYYGPKKSKKVFVNKPRFDRLIFSNCALLSSIFSAYNEGGGGGKGDICC